MKIIPADYREETASIAEVTHKFSIVQLVIGKAQVKKNNVKIVEFYRDKIAVDMRAHPLHFTIEVIDPEECGLRAVVLRVSASYYDARKSHFRNAPEANEVFFDEEILIPIEAIGMFGTGVASTEFMTNGYHREYLIARNNAR